MLIYERKPGHPQSPLKLETLIAAADTRRPNFQRDLTVLEKPRSR